jgi:hypothetical protein
MEMKRNATSEFDEKDDGSISCSSLDQESSSEMILLSLSLFISYIPKDEMRKASQSRETDFHFGQHCITIYISVLHRPHGRVNHIE